ncbi:hypothetical protein [Erythrobacter sp.]|uniref:hypothetical protein n=1 Tax=Erythrobacter sp. TaxID=1042 RepID=UPI0025ECBC89|nr:hypothetical protein [Erythrobacter sp.]
MKKLIPLACLALLACGPNREISTAPDTAPNNPPAGSPVVTPVVSLVGEYRVAGIDGAPIDAPIGLALTVTDSRIIFDAACGGFAWDYALEGSALATTRVVSPAPDCLARTSSPRVVFDLAAVIDAVSEAQRTPSNGIELAGGGRSVTLYSQ